MTDLLPALITTLGTLAGSFGGFTLAARSQSRQGDREDARAVRDADRARSIALEDERHEFQLKTLLSLQELTRLKTRYTLLVIEQDRISLKNGHGYRQLSTDVPDDFANAIEFSHNIARVTAPALRERLEQFSALCSEYSMPPAESMLLDQTEGIALQERRFVSLVAEATATTTMLGDFLRSEIDRPHRH